MVDPFSYFPFQSVLYDSCNKCCGMCCPVCGTVHIKEPLLLLEKSSPSGDDRGFHSDYLNEHLPYVCHHITVNNKLSRLGNFVCPKCVIMRANSEMCLQWSGNVLGHYLLYINYPQL